jgi:hypothetical protein
MKSHARVIAAGMMVGAGLLLAFGSWNEAAATNSFSCNNRTIRGSFGTGLSGTIVNGGDATYLISTDPGSTVSGTARRVGSLLFDRD